MPGRFRTLIESFGLLDKIWRQIWSGKAVEGQQPGGGLHEVLGDLAKFVPSVRRGRDHIGLQRIQRPTGRRWGAVGCAPMARRISG